MDVQWEEPPARALRVGSGQQRGRYRDFADALREHPGRWAVLPDPEPRVGEATRTAKGAAATAQNIRLGKVKGFKRGEYETAVDETKVWVRYKGPVDQPAPAGGDEDEVDEANGDDDETDADRRLRGPSAAEVRRWAHDNGFNVPLRGRLPENVFEAYERAHAPRPRAVPNL